MTDLQTAVVLLLVLLFSSLGILFTVRMIQFFLLLRQELPYINIEIQRSTGAEKEYWLHLKRKLLRSWLPFQK